MSKYFLKLPEGIVVAVSENCNPLGIEKGKGKEELR